MTGFELNRYLNYHAEMLALVGKIAALYIRDFADADAVAAVNDLERPDRQPRPQGWRRS